MPENDPMRSASDHADVSDSPLPFVGREEDITRLKDMLLTDTCRLITISGPGGTGKTRLARHIMEHMRGHFEDGAYFVPLHQITSPQFVIATIIEHVGYPLHGQDEPAQQLLRYLEDLNALIVLDNFEHVIASIDAVNDILQHTTSVKILVTSREVLNLRHEWVWNLTGVAYPQAGEIDKAAEYPAVKLFIDIARHVDPAFEPEPQLPHIVQIARLVEGNPLALELAASWLKALTCEDIATEIERNIDILSTRLRDVPERHRSIRSVFDYSWELLTDQEQHILKRLSVFPAGFNRQAASAVAGARLIDLTSLIDKSLLRTDARGHYILHELFRQYVYEKLAANQDELERVHRDLVAYYVQFLVSLNDELNGRNQLQAYTTLSLELRNIRPLWHDLLVYDDTYQARLVLQTLQDHYQARSNYREGIQLLLQAESWLQDLPDRAPLLVDALNNLGWLYIRVGSFDLALDALMRALNIIDRESIQMIPAIGSDPRITLGVLNVILSNYDDAARLGHDAYRDSVRRGDRLNQMTAAYLLASACAGQQDLDEAAAFAAESVEIASVTEHAWFKAYCLNEQGNIAIAQGDYVAARDCYEESYRIRETFGDSEGIAVALTHLGQIDLHAGEPANALHRFERSLSLYRAISDKGGLISALTGVATACVQLGRFRSGRDAALEALEIAYEASIPGWISRVLCVVSELYLSTNRRAQGADVLTIVMNSEYTSPETVIEAQKLIERYPFLSNSARLRDDVPTQPDALFMAALEAKQALPEMTLDDAAVSAGNQSGLVDPLSERELEILQLLSDGLTNQEIADQLYIVLGTVKTHNYNIYSKLGVKNRTQAINRARELNLITDS